MWPLGSKSISIVLQKETVERDGHHSTEIDCFAIYFFRWVSIVVDTVMVDMVRAMRCLMPSGKKG
jgi:hypothetical protein